MVPAASRSLPRSRAASVHHEAMTMKDAAQKIIDGLDDVIAFAGGASGRADIVTLEWPRCANGKPCGTDTVVVGRTCAGHTDGRCRHLSWLEGKPVLLLEPYSR